MLRKTKNISREKMIFWGIGLASLLAFPSFFRSPGKKKASQKVKMLTEDGKLVEIDVVNIPDKRKKISQADIHTWISKKISL